MLSTDCWHLAYIMCNVFTYSYLPEVNNLCCFNALSLYSEVNNSCDTVLQVCNTQCKIRVSSMDLLHFCSVLSLMLFHAYYLDCLFTNYYCDGLYTVYYAICYVINCIEVLVMTSIVGECWRIICHYIVRDYILVHQVANIGFIHSDCCIVCCHLPDTRKPCIENRSVPTGSAYRASKSPDFSGDLPIFDNIMKISRSPDLE